MTDLFGEPEDPTVGYLAEANRIKAEVAQCPDVASINALQVHYKEKLIGWRDHGTRFQKDMVDQIRNLIRYQINGLRYKR